MARLKQNGRHVVRVIRVLFRLASERGLSVAEAAKDFGVCERTIHRDLNICDGLGVPRWYDAAEGRHFVRRGWQVADLEWE